MVRHELGPLRILAEVCNMLGRWYDPKEARGGWILSDQTQLDRVRWREKLHPTRVELRVLHLSIYRIVSALAFRGQTDD